MDPKTSKASKPKTPKEKAPKAPRELKMDRRNIKERARIQKQTATIKRIGALIGKEDKTQQQIMDSAKEAIRHLNAEERKISGEIQEMDQKIFLLQQQLASYGPLMPFPPLGQPIYGVFPQPQQFFHSPGSLYQMGSSSTEFDEGLHEEEFFELEEEELDQPSSEMFVQDGSLGGFWNGHEQLGPQPYLAEANHINPLQYSGSHQFVNNIPFQGVHRENQSSFGPY